jgi:glycosyltransferase involved in cell wall biosynthesis
VSRPNGRRPAGPALVSVGLPVRNGERQVADAIRSILDQSHDDLELVIGDNASDDGTEEVCRWFARIDPRVRYERHPEDVGPVANFTGVLRAARGTYFRWVGHDDWLTSTYVARCVEVLAADPSLILVTTQQAHVGTDGEVETAAFDAARLRSDRPAERFAALLRLLTESHLLLDPLYGMLRRERVARLPRPVMLFEDQVLAARLALAGPFGHVPEVLSVRGFSPFPRLAVTARRLGVPARHRWTATARQSRELLVAVDEAGLDTAGRRQARAAVAGLFLRRQHVTAVRRARRVAAAALGSRSRAGPHPAT